MEKFVPFLLKWETGTVRRNGESNESLFERAKRTGYACDPDDRGGATMCGVTLATFTEWRRAHGKPMPAVADLKRINYDEWQAILKARFWDKCRADEIRNQRVAEIIADWVWLSGPSVIRRMQNAVGVAADGVVGDKTLAAIIHSETESEIKDLIERMKSARIAHIEEICRARPRNLKFRAGWLRRISDICCEKK